MVGVLVLASPHGLSRDALGRWPGQEYPTPAAAPVAQLDRVLASEAKGHRFESCRARH